MLGTLDFTGSEHGAPPSFSHNTTLLKVLKVGVCPLHV